MDTTQLATEGVQTAGKTAGLIADYGMLVIVGAVVVLGLMAALYLTFSYWKRKINGEYIKETEVVDYIKKNKPDILRLTSSDLPKLTDHPFFATCTTCIRSGESLMIEKNGKVDQVKTDLTRDLLVWNLRAYRNVLNGLVTAAYEHKLGFEEALGDSQKVRSIINEHLSIISGATKSKLIGEFEFPNVIYDAWHNSRKEKEKLFVDTVELIISQNKDAYSQLNNILNLFYSKVFLLEADITNFISNYDTSDISYISGQDVKEGTYSGFRKPNYSGYNPTHSATLENGWKSKI